MTELSELTIVLISSIIYLVLRFFIKRKKHKQWINEYNRGKCKRDVNTLRIKGLT